MLSNLDGSSPRGEQTSSSSSSLHHAAPACLLHHGSCRIPRALTCLRGPVKQLVWCFEHSTWVSKETCGNVRCRTTDASLLRSLIWDSSAVANPRRDNTVNTMSGTLHVRLLKMRLSKLIEWVIGLIPSTVNGTIKASCRCKRSHLVCVVVSRSNLLLNS